MATDATTDEMVRANAANWDARTPIHVASDFYSVATRDPEEWFAPYEWDDLGALDGRDLAHLQCHIGSETMAFARRGARVVGLDLSVESVRQARRIAAEAGLGIDYVHADVREAASALGRERFDVVYTGKGALCYVPDLDHWAGQVAALLRPGGLLYLVEFHPLLNSLGPVPGPDPALVLRHDYLSGRGPVRADGTFTYTDGPPLTEGVEHFEWRHGVGEVVTALIGAGLRLTLLRESEELPWRRWDSMVGTGGVWHRLPDDAPRLPLLFSIKAEKPRN